MDLPFGKFDDEFFTIKLVYTICLKATVIYGFHPDKIW